MSIILTIIGFVTSPLGRWVAIAGVAGVTVFGSYVKGRIDGRASYKAKIERQIDEAIQKGEQGRADALRKLDDGSVPDSWFRD